MLRPSRLLTLTRKSKFSKRTCPTRFFEYIPILGPVSSFEAQKLCKHPISKKGLLLCKCWPESQNLKYGPVPLNFSSTFRFWDPFLHSKLRNCANVQFPTKKKKKVDFCANVDQMSKSLRWTYLAQFFEYIPILESVPSFETWKLQKWLNSKCSKLRPSRSKFEIHPFNWDPRRVILQISSRLAFQSTNELSQVCLKITLGH